MTTVALVGLSVVVVVAAAAFAAVAVEVALNVDMAVVQYGDGDYENTTAADGPTHVHRRPPVYFAVVH